MAPASPYSIAPSIGATTISVLLTARIHRQRQTGNRGRRRLAGRHLHAAPLHEKVIRNVVPATEIETSLRSGEVDLAVGNFGDLQSAMLYQQRLFGHSYIVVVHKDHPGIGDAMSRKQFLDGLHAVVHSEGQPEGAFEALLRQQGLTRRVVLRLKHYLAIPAILRESNLIFTVPYAIGTSLAEFANIKLLKPPIARGHQAVLARPLPTTIRPISGSAVWWPSCSWTNGGAPSAVLPEDEIRV
jgi:DNA-binding transcriptional LysR family regulator